MSLLTIVCIVAIFTTLLLAILCGMLRSRLKFSREQLAQLERQAATTSEIAGEVADDQLKNLLHRVKNDLQVISSLLNLQIDHTIDREAQRQLKTVSLRIRCVSLLYEQLHGVDQKFQIGFAEYANRLVDHVVQAHPDAVGRIGVNISVASVTCNLQTAVSCGLILSELIENALTHAFPEDRSGKINVVLRQKNPSSGAILEASQNTLIVRDNGVGLDSEFDPGQSENFGMQLVAALVRQLKGEFRHYSDNGAIFEITFPRSR